MSIIFWQTRSPVLYDSWTSGRLDKVANGGNAYEFHAMQALSKTFDLRLDPSTVQRRTERSPLYWLRMRRHQPKADLVVKDLAALTLGALGTAGVEVAMVHHIDFDLRQSSLKHQWYFDRFMRRLPRMDAVVTVSQYWADEIRKLGCRRVEVIYNAFDIGEFTFDQQEVQAFLDAHQIPTDRPLVYIGNAVREKGVVEVYEALKGEGYTLVMTGRRNEVDLPVHFFTLERPDYLRLLHACDVVITMSTLLEGWNRVAHEAMLCRTPVIGSGIGGMRELLEGGRQRIVSDVARLPDAVRGVLDEKEELGRQGYAFAKRFDAAYFEEAWTVFVAGLLPHIPQRTATYETDR